MKNFVMKKYLFIFVTLIYFDLVHTLCLYHTTSFGNVFNMIIFDLLNAGIIFFLTSFFSKKVNNILTIITYVFLGFWYSLYFVYFSVFESPFSLHLLRQTGQVLEFGGNIIKAIIANIFVILLFFLPLVIFIILRNKLVVHAKLKAFVAGLCVFVLSIMFNLCNVYIGSRKVGSVYNLVCETENVALSIEKLGVMHSTFIDIKRIIFGFEEKIIIVDPVDDDDEEEKKKKEEEEKPKEYAYNNLDINFTGTDQISTFMASETGTKQNEYTGYFEGKNLVYIVAESFSELGVREDLTPTLYKLVHDGFYFKNFYTSNNSSTLGGEFQAITGLYADNSALKIWQNGTNSFPYGLARVFQNKGYNTYAFHDHNGYFQNRYVYLPSP